MSTLFIGANSGDIADATSYQANWDLLESSFQDLGSYVVSGLVPSVGTGLSVNLTSGTASIGGEVTKATTWTIGSLTPSTTNHLYLQRDGTGTSNTTGTQPVNTVKLGTALTGVATVTSVDTTRTSGRQLLVRTESLVPGGPGAGNPASISLAAWAAAAANSVTVFGTLPDGALSANVPLINAANSFTAAQSINFSDAGTTNAPVLMTVTHNTSGTAAAGLGSEVDFVNEGSSGTTSISGWLSALYAGGTTGAENGTFIWGSVMAGTKVELMRFRTTVGMAPSGGVGGQVWVKADLLHSGNSLSFFNAAQVTQPANTSDLRQALIDLGLRATGGATPLDLNGGNLKTAGLLVAFAAKTTTYTLTDSDHTITADAGVAAFTVTLPTASGRIGKQFTIKRINSGANAVTLQGNGAETIDGSNTQALTAQWQSFTVEAATATTWILV